MIQKALEERIPNHILHVQCECKTSVSQSNLLYPLFGVYVYNYLKSQKMSKCLLRNGAESNNTSSYILLDHSNAFSLSGGFFVDNNLTRAYLKRGKGVVNFQLFPLLGPPCILTGPNWHIHNFAMGPTI